MNKIIILLFVSLFYFQPLLQAQKKTKELAKFSLKKIKRLGKKLDAQQKDYQAIEYYKEALFKAKKPKHQLYFNEKIADAYFKTRNYKMAGNAYEKAVNLNRNHKKRPLLEMQLARCYKNQAKYDTAIVMYDLFLSLQKENDKISLLKRGARLEKKGALYALTLSCENLDYRIENLGENINGPLADFGPALLNDSLFFTKVYTEKDKDSKKVQIEKSFSKIYYSDYYKEKFNVFQDFSDSINLSYRHTGNPSFSSNGNEIYFSQCTSDKKQNIQCKIFYSTKKENKWTTPKALNDQINLENTNSTQPNISKLANGEKILYFVSDRTRGRGGNDIWYSKIDSLGNYNRPRNAGYPINTSFDEVSPFFHTASNSLYFSSNGHRSIGGFDVFKIVKNQEDDWEEEVQNLNYPINSSYDDYDFIFNEKKNRGFLSSNRASTISKKHATCCDDIYIVESTEVNIYIAGTVYAQNKSKRKKYRDAKIFLSDSSMHSTPIELEYSPSGTYLAKVLPNKDYTLIAKSIDFEEVKLSFSTKDIKKSDTLQYDLYFEERKFDNYIIGQIYYEFNDSKLRDDAPQMLDKVVAFMKIYPNTIVEVASHTDAKGSAQYNMNLSERRSLAVKNYLIYQKGVAPNRLINKWYGEGKTVAPNVNENGTDNPEGRALNRRTEFIVTGRLEN